MLPRGHDNRLACAVDNFSGFNAAGQNRSVLLRDLAAFCLEERARFHNQDSDEFLVGLRHNGVKICVYFYEVPMNIGPG